VAQSFNELTSSQALQVIARLAQANAMSLHLANQEIASDKMIERDATRD
jgi:hypothetical protein